MSAKPARLLVVDDQASTAYLAKIMLEGAGYAVDEAIESQDAIKRINTSNYDALLLDLHLADMSALELLRHCPLHPPTVLTTGGVAEVPMAEAVALGVVEVVRKPFTAAGLVESIQRALVRVRRHDTAADDASIYLDMPVVAEVRNAAGRAAGERFVRKAIADAEQLIGQIERAAPVMKSALWLEHVQSLSGIASTMGARALKRATDEAMKLTLSEIPGRAGGFVVRFRDVLAKTAEQLMAQDELLSERERACLKLIAQGQSTPAIAHTLGVTPKTVEYYVAKAGAKLEAKGRAAIVAQAMLRGEI